MVPRTFKGVLIYAGVFTAAYVILRATGVLGKADELASRYVPRLIA